MIAAPPRNLERYQLVKRVAVGGMAEVFLAKAYGAHGFEKTLAVKRILPELAANKEFEDRFIAEAKLAVKLTHANVVQVFDFGRFEESLFIAMEYVDGVDLAALLSRYRARNERIPLPAAFQIAIDIARGLDYAHQRGVIHRDVSPSNILLSQSGDVKIADFGIALTNTGDLAKSSHRNRIMGKWRYMSPEQTRGQRLETRSDLFAAAAVMYELFIGEKLFPGDEVEDIVRNIKGMEIPSASAKRTGLPPKLDAILAKALSRDPGERPRRAAEVQRELTEISYESSIVATPLDVAEAVSLVADKKSLLERPRTPPQRRDLDDLIRAQLSGSKTHTERRTAVGDEDEESRDQPENRPGDQPDDRPDDRRTEDLTPAELLTRAPGSDPDERKTERNTATMVRRGIGPDGVTVWTLDKSEAASQSALKNRRLVPVLLAAAAILAIGGYVWQSGVSSPPAVAEIPMPDAGLTDPSNNDKPATGVIIIDSTPSAAQIRLDGKKLAQLTPATITVRAEAPHWIEVLLAGYYPGVREGVTVRTRGTTGLHIKLEPRPASMSIRSEPPGASIMLNGRQYGITPAELNNLTPGPGQTLALSKRGHESWTKTFDLLPGGHVPIDEKLRPKATRPQRPKPAAHGFIDVSVRGGGWAEIYLNQQQIGTAPKKGLKLPVGRHRLRFYNSVTKKEAFQVVEVVQGATKFVWVEL